MQHSPFLEYSDLPKSYSIHPVELPKKPDERARVKGEITAKCYDQSKLFWYEKLWNKFVYFAKLDIKKFYIFGDLKWKTYKTNVIANEGFQAIGEILVGTYASTGAVTKMALGTSTTPVSASDSQLGTETYRNDTYSGTASGNITYITAVYTETEVSGTFQEFGNFIDGTGTANSGQLWSHILTGGWTKTLTDVLVVDCKYTFTSS